MIAPQFSLRTILAVTAVCGFVSLIGAAAVRGTPWARAIMLALAALALILIVHALMFFIMWLFSLILPGRRAAGQGQSPFAGGPSPGSR
ncbi:MAG TPA: hypothetical protein VNH11_18990 [Pirellulales bacterium]|nr:hypothetical protein [Pirellulales bacterium]